MRVSTLVLVALALALQACSSVGPVAPDPGPVDPGEQPVAGYPAYETFDPAGYDVEPQPTGAIVHDVPPGVMAGRVVVPDNSAPPAPATPQPRQVDGFRVQIFSTANRDTAERVRQQAVDWWTNSGGDARSLGAMVAYLQPYYRVRLGAFGTREAAEYALAQIRSEYPEAFLVPDLVTITD